MEFTMYEPEDSCTVLVISDVEIARELARKRSEVERDFGRCLRNAYALACNAKAQDLDALTLW